jgi:hypothetical protein
MFSVQILNEEHKKYDTMTRQKNRPNERVLFKRFSAFLLDSKNAENLTQRRI